VLQEVVYDISYTLRLPEQQLNRSIPNVLRACASLATLPVRLFKFGKTLASGEEHGAPLSVLKECKGVLRSGTTTLLVSPPGHCKTSFLRALSGLLPGPAGGSLEGTVRYNGVNILDPKAVKASGVNLRLLASYTEQLDNHLPFLTVRETLTFAWSNSAVQPSASLLGNAELASLAERKVDDVIALLKLGGCQDTLIGNEFIRGVSGGEKKRVTIGETLVSDARLLCMDEISTGLDASVTYEICSALRQWARTKKITVVISLLQPTPETVGTFDDIVLMRVSKHKDVCHGKV
jgi:ABC-type multidrug transport system ATPase subunit